MRHNVSTIAFGSMLYTFLLKFIVFPGQKTSRDNPGMAWCGKQQFTWSNYCNSKFQLKGVACVDAVSCVGINVSYTYNCY